LFGSFDLNQRHFAVRDDFFGQQSKERSDGENSKWSVQLHSSLLHRPNDAQQFWRLPGPRPECSSAGRFLLYIGLLFFVRRLREELTLTQGWPVAQLSKRLQAALLERAEIFKKNV
jgi:hypothetical protein